MVLGMVGVPWEIVFGRKSAHIPVEIKDNGREIQVGDEEPKAPDDDEEVDEMGVKLRGSVDKSNVSRNVISK